MFLLHVCGPSCYSMRALVDEAGDEMSDLEVQEWRDFLDVNNGTDSTF